MRFGKSRKNGKKSKKSRTTVCIIITAAIFAVFAIRLVDWQLVQGKNYKSLAAKSTGYTEKTDATRGEIVDRNGVGLVVNTTKYKIVLNKLYIEEDRLDGILLELAEILNEAYNSPQKYKFYNIMLQKADLNILAYRPIVEDRNIPIEFSKRIQNEDLSEKIKDVLLRPTIDSIAFLNHSTARNFEIPLKWQSKGTLKYIRILDTLYNMITNPHVYFLDELGEDLHNDLLFYYLNVFIFNSGKSQLIITSQETTLLSQDLINENRGVVWFVEKNKDTASSEYSRGDSFGLHKNLSLYNSYRIGRLGAKPELGSIFINLED